MTTALNSIPRYVVGFVFDPDRQRLMLVRKNRPAWQAGKLNGIGGKIESGESAVAAMVRECQEESGLHISESSWRELGKLHGSYFELFVFVAEHDFVQSAPQSLTDELVDLYSIDSGIVDREGVSNLGWLVRMALDEDSPRFSFEVTYNEQ